MDTTEMLDSFRKDGYVALPGYFSQDEVAGWAEDIGWLVETQLLRLGGRPCETGAAVRNLSRNLIALDTISSAAQSWIYDEVNRRPWMHALAGNNRLVDLALQLTETKHVGVHPRLNMVMAMPGNDWHLADWHQDAYYGPHHLVAYVPLQATGSSDGGLMAARGGHVNGLLDHAPEHNSLGSKFHAISGESLADADIVQLELSAGDLLLFNGYLPHAASANSSADVRFALTIRYTDLENQYFINRGWVWADLSADGLAALQSRKKNVQ